MMDVYVNYYNDGRSVKKQVDPQTLVGDFTQSLTEKPWERELLLNDKVLPVEKSLVDAGVLHESELVLQPRDVNPNLDLIASYLSTKGTKKRKRETQCAICEAAPGEIFSFVYGKHLCGSCEITRIKEFLQDAKIPRRTSLARLQAEESELSAQLYENREQQTTERELLSEMWDIESIATTLEQQDTVDLEMVKELQAAVRDHLCSRGDLGGS